MFSHYRLILFLLLPGVCLLNSGCSAPSSEKAFVSFASSVQEGNWDTVYGMLSEETRARVDSLVTAALPTHGLAEDVADMDPADRFAAVVDNDDSLFALFDFSGYQLIDTNDGGTRATVTIRRRTANRRELELVRLHRENGGWKISL